MSTRCSSSAVSRAALDESTAGRLGHPRRRRPGRAHPREARRLSGDHRPRRRRPKHCLDCRRRSRRGPSSAALLARRRGRHRIRGERHRTRAVDAARGGLPAGARGVARAHAGHLLRSPAARASPGRGGDPEPAGCEIGTMALEVVADDPLLAAVQPPPLANAVHLDTIGTLPPGARVLARTAIEPHAVLRFSETAWGVQFHPEADADILRDTIDARRDSPGARGARSRRADRGRARCCGGRLHARPVRRESRRPLPDRARDPRHELGLDHLAHRVSRELAHDHHLSRHLVRRRAAPSRTRGAASARTSPRARSRARRTRRRGRPTSRRARRRPRPRRRRGARGAPPRSRARSACSRRS